MKRVLPIILLVSVLMIFTTACTSPTSSKTTSGSSSSQKVSSITSSSTSTGSGKITKAEFDKIQNGMTYEQVKAIIGSDGEVLSEVGEKGSDYYTIAYMWNGEGSIGANANFMFQKNKLMTKAQFGLE